MRYRYTEKTIIFLSLIIVFLGIIFLTRDREILLKQEIITGLGIALNLCIAIWQSLRARWMTAVIAMILAVTAALILAAQLFLW